MGTLGGRTMKRVKDNREVWYCICGSEDHQLVLDVGWDALSDEFDDTDFGEFEIVVRYQPTTFIDRLRAVRDILLGRPAYYAVFQFAYGDGVTLRDALNDILKRIEERTSLVD